MFRQKRFVVTNQLNQIVAYYSNNRSRLTFPCSGRVIVLKSQFHDPYLNLGYENWMYENIDFENHDVLYFWQNLPSVVIGRHQNPWLECNLKYLKGHEIKVARRHSGGGTVYHDMGNLNVTFMTSRSKYDRKKNLQLIAHSLSKTWGLDIDLSSRDDLILDGLFKVSGSAAKLGKSSSYHHCTILCDTDLDKLTKSITSQMTVTSKSTASVRSVVTNLKDQVKSLEIDEVMNCIAQTYAGTDDVQILKMHVFDEHFHEITKMKDELMTWEWIYGKTSPFMITKTFAFNSGIIVNMEIVIKAGSIDEVTLTPNVPIQDKLNKIMKGVRLHWEDLSQRIAHFSLENNKHQNNTGNDVHVITNALQSLKEDV
ncbi:lipoyltransferase 1, mitochondrial-like [Xenia sp. Carnegie-2017]|uniref:lipoyltransferase 1, mitochondrial-like n=1 Tax=Xenia sp. Carnegie-2017 TaxID=2897299 RepID=UPI001F036928|nr:lipoyltransferase 1, mitochondrial-like [Xenia sp. Carnegie-2017]